MVSEAIVPLPLRLALAPTLTHAQARACTLAWEGAMAQNPSAAVCMDAAALQRFDSSAIAALLACRRSAITQGRAWQLTGLPAAALQLAQLYGVGDLLTADSDSNPV